jgi:hypothetical protein
MHKNVGLTVDIVLMRSIVISTFISIGIDMLYLLFALFSSMCEQKVSAYMPSWALLVMTAVW